MSALAAAVVGTAVVGGIMSADAQQSAAATAAGAQTASTQAGIAEQQRQFDRMQQILSPYVQGGQSAFTQQQALAGVFGDYAQKHAISGIESSPQFQALVRQGEESMLQNAAATGGLRGGNTQAALAQFRPNMLSQMIESQYSKLSDISRIGQASAAGVGAAGQATGANIANLLQQQGQAQAQAALASGQATANMWGNIAGGVGMAAGMF